MTIGNQNFDPYDHIDTPKNDPWDDAEVQKLDYKAMRFEASHRQSGEHRATYATYSDLGHQALAPLNQEPPRGRHRADNGEF
jgi:hypothetical protein